MYSVNRSQQACHSDRHKTCLTQKHQSGFGNHSAPHKDGAAAGGLCPWQCEDYRVVTHAMHAQHWKVLQQVMCWLMFTSMHCLHVCLHVLHALDRMHPPAQQTALERHPWTACWHPQMCHNGQTSLEQHHSSSAMICMQYQQVKQQGHADAFQMQQRTASP